MLQRLGLFSLSTMLTAICYSLIIWLTISDSSETNALALIFLYCFAILALTSLSVWFLLRVIVKYQAGIDIVSPPKNTTELWLVATTKHLAKQANITPPQVGIFPTGFSTAFSVSTDHNHALIAVSRGLLFNFNENEVEAILAREISSIKDGSNATICLLQSLTTLTNLGWAYLIGNCVERFLPSQRVNNHPVQRALSVVLAVPGSFTSLAVACYFNRQRHFHADANAQAFVSSHDIRQSLTHLAKLKSQNNLSLTIQPLCFAPNNLPDALETASFHPCVGKRILYLRSHRQKPNPMDIPIKTNW